MHPFELVILFAKMLSKLVFPHPLGPITATSSNGFTYPLELLITCFINYPFFSIRFPDFSKGVLKEEDI